VPLDDQELHALISLHEAVGTGRNDPRFAHDVLAAVRALTRVDAAALWLRNCEDPDLAVRHRSAIDGGESAEDLLVAQDDLLTHALLHGPTLVEDMSCSPLRTASLRSAGVHSLAIAPIEVGGRRLGAIAAFAREGQTLAPGALRLLRVAAGQVAVVLATHTARADHADAIDRERTLAGIVTQTAETLTLEGALSSLVDGVRRITGAPLGAVLLSSPSATRVMAASGPALPALCSPSAVGKHELAGLETVIDPRMLASARPLIFADGAGLLTGLRTDGRRVAAGDGHGIRFCILAPIVVSGAVVGALLVASDADHPNPAVLGPLETLAAHAGGILRRARLLAELEQTYADAVGALAQALEAKDEGTHEHSREMADLACSVGSELGLDVDELRDLEYTAILHDIGKIAIPDDILLKPGPLTEDEWAFMRKHTSIGERILRGVPFLEDAARAVRSAHERWDGTGYPDGLTCDDIPLLSRIVFACDTWHVMTSDRPYRSRLPRPEALRRLRAEAGRQLDPNVVGALLTVLGEELVPLRATI
jgi:putative nucleotidyltransferase with HDIG domain